MNDLASMTTGDGRFAYEAAGDAASPALVLLHGVGGAARAWRNQVSFFSRSFRVIAWDMPGYGGSSSLSAVSIASLAQALRDFLAILHVSKPALLGHSIGGMIVQQLLASDPDIASAAILAQTSPAFGRPDGDWQRAFIEARLGPLDRGETLSSLAPTLVTELVGDAPNPAGLEAARECMASVPEASYRAMMHALIGFDLRDQLQAISIPTLVLSGSKDSNAPAPMMAKMAARIPDATYVELPGVGHLANLERPEAFNLAVGDFLQTKNPEMKGRMR